MVDSLVLRDEVTLQQQVESLFWALDVEKALGYLRLRISNEFDFLLLNDLIQMSVQVRESIFAFCEDLVHQKIELGSPLDGAALDGVGKV